MSDDTNLFSAAGYQLPAAVAAAPAATAAPTSSLFEGAGYSLPTGKETKPKSTPASKQFSDEIPIPAPGTPGYVPGTDTTAADTLENRIAALNSAIDPYRLASGLAKNWWEATKQQALSGLQTYQQGIGDVRRSMTATGLGEGGLGVLQMATSPLGGALKAGVQDPVTQLTGNPEIGQRVADTAGLFLPTKGAHVAAKTATEGGALTALVNTIGPENVPAAVAAARANPRSMLMDVSPALRTVSRGLLDPAQPQAQNIITSAVRNRAATLPQAINSAYTATMGPNPNVVVMLDALKRSAEDVGKQAIEPALANAKPVNVSPVLKSIDDEIGADPVGKASLRSLKAGDNTYYPLSDYQQRLFQLRQQLTSGVGDQSVSQFLDAGGEQGAHKIQSGLRAEAQNLLTSASGADRNLGGKLMGMRNKLVDVIDTAAPGYKDSLGKYRDAMQVQEAFDHGFSGGVLKNRQGHIEDRPEAFQQWMDNATPEQVVAMRLGTRADIDRSIRGVKNQSLAGQNIAGIEYNREKLESLFGKPEATRLTSAMENAAAESRTNASILGGSETAQTQAGQRALSVRQAEPFAMRGPIQAFLPSAIGEAAGEYLGLPPGIAGAALFAAGAGGGIAKKAMQSFQKAIDTRRNIAFAKMASATGPERDRVINALITHPQVVRQAQKSGNALTASNGP